MSEIKAISQGGKSASAAAASPSRDDFRRASELLAFELPASYVEFCQRGGLADLRFSHRILGPGEILASRNDAPCSLVPFADNGCGELFCWPIAGGPEPAVIFYEQETQASSPAAASFTEWLARNHF